MFADISGTIWYHHCGPLLFSVTALAIVLLAENCRLPIDDPNTHLELTMIHEVMILDNSGPDLALFSMLLPSNFWLFSALIINLVLPSQGLITMLIGLATAAVIIGMIESTMARLRLVHVPRLLMAAMAFSILALVFGMR